MLIIDGAYIRREPKKITLKMKILNNAYKTIVANGNHNYVIDPMNNIGCECPLNLITKEFDSVLRLFSCP